jgi:outer membrane protein assembly factor BamB
VYVGSFDGVVYCFNLVTGAKVWSHETEGTTLNSGNYGFDRRSIQSSPAVAHGVVYIGARDGFVYALDASTGARRWRYDQHVSWINSSPAVAGGLIFDGSSDAQYLQALDTAGNEVWRSKTDAIVWSSPAVAGEVVYFGDGAGRTHAVDRATGAERWVFRPLGQTYSSPVVAGDLVIVGNSDGNVYALRANAGTPVKRAVFFDSTALGKGHVPASLTTARNFTARGYTMLDTSSVVQFFTDRIADQAPSVVVFALDYLPQALVGDNPDSSLFRRYLQAGGKVVWTGPPPRLFPLVMPPGKIDLDWLTASRLTSVPQDSSLFDSRGVRATPEGARWGLKPRWRDAWSVAPAGVTQVLGLDEWGLASAYLKSFGGAPGTGFVRVPPDDPVVLYLVAEKR